MRCYFCGALDSKVIDSRPTDEGYAIRRRRECVKCGRRFTTYEKIETIPMIVVKKDGSRQPFDAEKIKRGLMKAIEKRPISVAQIDKLAGEVETYFQNSLEQEISIDLADFLPRLLHPRCGGVEHQVAADGERREEHRGRKSGEHHFLTLGFVIRAAPRLRTS